MHLFFDGALVTETPGKLQKADVLFYVFVTDGFHFVDFFFCFLVSLG